MHALEQAIKYYTDQGRFSSAAKHQVGFLKAVFNLPSFLSFYFSSFFLSLSRTTSLTLSPLQQEIAEIHEADNAIDLAIDSYLVSADMYEGENAVSSANKCLAQAAQLYTQKEEYAKAVKYLEKVAANSLSVREGRIILIVVRNKLCCNFCVSVFFIINTFSFFSSE